MGGHCGCIRLRRRRPDSSYEAPDLTPGLRPTIQRKHHEACFRNVPLACVLKYWPDGKALPKRLDRFSMTFFKPPPNTLEPYQLELCADAFRRTWFEIAPRDYRLPPSQEERLQTEVSAKLCFFAAKGVMDLGVLQGLTVATVKFQPRTGRRRRLTGTPQTIAG